MSRRYIDCREHPDSAEGCTLAISADTADEVMDAAVQHATAAHGLNDTPELRDQLKTMIKEGSPPA